jgi:hypothetical protein
MGMIAPSRKLRWYQFSLRTLLIVGTLFSVLCSWLAVKLQQHRREREAAAAIERLGGTVHWHSPTVGHRLRTDEYDLFDYVNTVDCYGPQVTDACLEHLKVLRQLGWLYLEDTTTTDAGLETLAGMSQLERLILDGTKVTDKGLAKLRGLRHLQVLGLDRSEVTDVGMEHLKELDQLVWLSLENTAVSDAGLETLAGMNHQLQGLDLRGTKVTDEGVRRLQGVFPGCKIER